MPVTHPFVNPQPDGADATVTRPSDWNAAHTVSIDNADVANAAAIVESKLSLNFATHAAVTVADTTSIDMSISGQQISAAAIFGTTSTTIAQGDHTHAQLHDAVTLDTNADTLLSLSTQALGLDTQLANKVFAGATSGGAAIPAFRSLVAADIPALSYVDGSGVAGQVTEWVDSNTIQAAKIIGPAVNILTILNPTAAKSITFPGTSNDTVAMLATANVFTTQLKIDGSQDIIQHIVQAHSTQTTNVWELQTSAAAIVNSMSLTAGAIFNEQGDAAIDFRVESDTEANMLFLDSSANAIGIKQATPTAYLHLGAGSTAAGTAPLKFTQDATSLLTAVEAGAMEYYHNSLWFTNLAVRRTVVQAQSVVLVDQTIANSTVETTIFTQAHGANYLQVGKCEEITIQGIISSLNTGLPAANALTIRVKYAGATLGTFTVLKSATANRNYEIHVRITCRAIGSGTTTIQVHCNADVEGIPTDPVFNGTSTGLDSTTAQATTVTVQWTDASASNTTTIQQGYALSIDNNA